MQLSMWTLYDELAQFDRENSILDGQQCIEAFRVISDDSSILEECVYIGDCAEFFGIDTCSVILAHRRDYIIIKNARLIEVVNCVIGIFFKYQQWGERLNAAMHNPEPFQAVMNVAHDLISCPMFFGKKNMRIVAITNQYSSNQFIDEWDTIKRFKVIPTCMIKRLMPFNLPAKYPDEIDPAIIPTICGTREHECFKYAIRTACYFNGEIWGHLFVFYKNKRVLFSVLQMLRYIANIFEQLLHKLPEVRNGYFYCTELTDLLDGRSISQDIIDKLYYMFNWNESTPLFVYKMIPSGQEFDKMIFDSVCIGMADRFNTSIVFPYRNSIVMVTSQDSSERESKESIISSSFLLGNFKCGRSLPFYGLEKFAVYYQQAGYAIMLNENSGDRLHFFEDCAYSGIVKAFSRNPDWRCWIHPSLVQLRDVDISQGTEYFKTLYCFLRNKGHYGNTANELYIHRNTLTYRLSRVTDMLGLEIHNEDVAAYLRFCYELLITNGVTFPNPSTAFSCDPNEKIQRC